MGPTSCTHSLDNTPILCCTSSQMDSGAVLLAACTRETLHLRLIDQVDPSHVSQEHRCPLNTAISQHSQARVYISPCSRHILVADPCSVSTYSISEAVIAARATPASAATSTATEQAAICLRQFKPSMSYNRPQRAQQGAQEPADSSWSLPSVYWRTQCSINGSGKSSTHFFYPFVRFDIYMLHLSVHVLCSVYVPAAAVLAHGIFILKQL
jgi:hypothetical protein